jgi:hypothetical protein
MLPIAINKVTAAKNLFLRALYSQERNQILADVIKTASLAPILNTVQSYLLHTS